MARFADRHHHPLTIAALVMLFWSIAAALDLATQIEIVPRSPIGGAVTTIAALVITAFAYMRLVARGGDVTHALGVGIAWLSLSITAELALAAHLGHGWFSLLGSPAQPLFRNVILFIWIFAPAVFARRASE